MSYLHIQALEQEMNNVKRLLFNKILQFLTGGAG